MRPNPEPWSERQRAKWRRPLTLTALIPLGAESEVAVQARLAALAPRLEKSLAAVSDLHSSRLVLVPPRPPDTGGARVLFNSVHDRPLDEHLAALVSAAGALLVEALRGADFSGQPADLPNLLLRCRVPESTFHLGAINQSVSEILAENNLRELIEVFADQRMASGQWTPATPAESIRQEIREYVLAQPPERHLPRGPAPTLSPEGRCWRFLDLLVTFAFPAIGVLAPHIARAIQLIGNPAIRLAAWAGFGLWWIYGAVFTGGAMLLVRFLELTEPDVALPPPDSAKLARLEATEDLRLMNTVTIWFAVRDTWIRRLLMRIILWGSERGCRHFWTHGALADIDTIHYARILHVEQNRAMIFLSDYDGSFDRYLLDFLGVGSSAVIPISSNVAGCPKTRWLFYPDDLAVFGPRFIDLLRSYQLETAMWYSAYPNLTVRDILANAALRKGLFAPEMAAADAAQWVARL